MEHLISVYYKEDHHHRIHSTIFVPLEQKEKKGGRGVLRGIRYSPAFSRLVRTPRIWCVYALTLISCLHFRFSISEIHFLGCLYVL